MPRVAQERHGNTAYAGLDFIKAAFCPLEFNACRLAEHPKYAEFGNDEALADLEVADPLTYVRQFPYSDVHGNRKTGTQAVTAHFGLAPKDFDLFLGLYTYLKRLPELPADGRSHLTIDFIARQLHLPADGQSAYMRIRSRIFRLSYVKYTSSAFFNRQTRTFDIRNFGFFNLASLSRMTESRRPVVFEWDPGFLDIAKNSTLITFDYDLYRTLSPALRRFYLIANRDGWNQRDSSLFIADDFAVNQIGFSERPELRKHRMHRLRALLREAEELGLIRPLAAWRGYMQPLAKGPRAGELALRWSRGPRLKCRAGEAADRLERQKSLAINNDALYAQVKELTDEDRSAVTPPVYRRLIARFGRDMMQKHVAVVLAQKEHRQGSFKKSELATYINRMQHDYPEPDWYQDLKRAERVSLFNEVSPNQLSLDIYGTFFRE